MFINFFKKNKALLPSFWRRIFSNLRYFLGVFVFLESLYVLIFFISQFYKKFQEILDKFQYLFGVLFFVFTFLFICLLTINIIKIYKSKRADIFLSSLSGLFLFFSYHMGSLNYFIIFDWKKINFLPNLPWFILMSLAIVLFVIAQLIKLDKTKKSLFLSDDALEDTNDDCLGYKEDAKIFSEQVLNNMSKSSFVFGLDAPWGMGKSSFINICKDYWKSDKNVIVLDFEPLRFESNNILFKSFVTELIKTIRKNGVAPEIQSAFYKYIKSILRDIKINFGIFSLSFNKNSNIDSKFFSLKEELKIFDKKIVIIIDDLDRLSTSYVKIVLDIVKKSFTFPNITYVLCYDTENLNCMDNTLKITESTTIEEGGKFTKQDDGLAKITKHIEKEKIDNEKLVEYIEKIVNVKKTLVIPRSKLRDFLVKHIEEINIDQKLSIFPKESLEKIIYAVDHIFSPKNYHQYIKYLGDLRKIKRFLNIFKMQVAYNLDIVHGLNKIDIDFLDLIHLMLLYINYPKIFRKIYNTETDGGNEFFSLKINYASQDGFEFVNSEEYGQYIKELTADENFLVSQIFDYKKFNRSEEDFELIKSTSAAFNGTLMTSRNLEDYLKVITKGSMPNILESYTIHQTNVLRFIEGISTMEQIFDGDAYVMNKDNDGEKYRSVFYSILINNIDKLSHEKAVELIIFMLDDIKNYSTVEHENLQLGLRKAIPLKIVYILNKRGWQDEKGKNYNNSKENITTIAKFIFGEDSFNGKSILDRLSHDKDGYSNVLNMLDLLHLRLYCSQDRGSGMFNLYNALQYHHNDEAETDGLIRDILVEEMREITQKIFHFLKEKYIVKKKNIFKEIEDLTEKQLFSLSYDYIKNDKDWSSKMKELAQKEKSIIVNYILYQVSSSVIDSGIGVGYYDESGSKDEKNIRVTFNDYLFNTCFDVSKEDNISYFIYYLLSSLKAVRNLHTEISEYEPDLNYYTRILDKEKLLTYWECNRGEIKKYLQENRGRTITFYSYTVSYEEDGRNLLKFLDKELKEKQDGESKTK